MEDIKREVANIARSLHDLNVLYMKAHNILDEEPPAKWNASNTKDFEDIAIVEIVPNLCLSGLLLKPPMNVFRATSAMVAEHRITAVIQLSEATTKHSWMKIVRDPQCFMQIVPIDGTLPFEDMYRACVYIDERLKAGNKVCVVGLHRQGVAAQLIIAYLMYTGFPFELAHKTLATRSPGAEPSRTDTFIKDVTECAKKRKKDEGGGGKVGRPRKVQPNEQ